MQSPRHGEPLSRSRRLYPSTQAAPSQRRLAVGWATEPRFVLGTAHLRVSAAPTVLQSSSEARPARAATPSQFRSLCSPPTGPCRWSADWPATSRAQLVFPLPRGDPLGSCPPLIASLSVSEPPRGGQEPRGLNAAKSWRWRRDVSCQSRPPTGTGGLFS